MSMKWSIELDNKLKELLQRINDWNVKYGN
jgi:hypothetical protein